MTAAAHPAPPPSAVKAALKAIAAVVGAEAVFSSEEDQSAYSDPFSHTPESHAPAGAVAPGSVEEIRAIVRIANQHKVPLWTISRGKNLGFGGAAPVHKGSITLDLSRLKKIELDVENGVVLVEPGVSFYDLYDHLKAANAPYWLSVPGNSWGSVVGNALERGVGYTPYGAHGDRICGIEAVLPDGDLVRTGMGAMDGSPTWQLYKNGFGPAWDSMFCQSNFGIVTKMGLWLMPAPEAMLGFDLEFEHVEDLPWIVDVMATLRREGVVQQSPSIGNWLRTTAVSSTREQWSDKPGRLDAGAIDAVRKANNLGWWNLQIRLYGRMEMTEAASRVVEKAFNGHPVLSMKKTRWTHDDPPDTSSWTGAPTTVPLANANWHGGRGGHMGFSPVIPFNGKAVWEQYLASKRRYDEFDLDHQVMFSLNERSVASINQVFYDKDDADMVGRVHSLLKALFDDAHAKGYGEYRTHIEEMDRIAGSFDFNNNALRRLNEKLKDALDPNGILSPGKSGIWPAAYRKGRG